MEGLSASTHAQSNIWDDFMPGHWQYEIDLRAFIVRNTQTYNGNGTFLAPISARTKDVFETLKPYLAEEAKKGVLDAEHDTRLSDQGPVRL